MFRRLVSLGLLAWLFGFAWFAMFLPQPAGKQRTDAAVVFTGGEGRVARGLDIIAQRQAPRLLVSGVHPDVKPGEFQAEYQIAAARMTCCITLGYESADTRANGAETANWLARHKARSVRLITSDWHMRRAALELERQAPGRYRILRDAVASEPSLSTLFKEYNKYLARRIAVTLQG